MAKHLVKCYYCGKTFDANIEPFEKVTSRRYAHSECHKQFLENNNKEANEKQALEEYIMKLFGTEFVDPRVQKQIKQYQEQYNYTYSGIHKALIYHYEIRHGDKTKANGGIGIVPYVYQAARNYYYELWLAQQRNADKVVETYVPKVKEVIIPVPRRQPRKKKFFTFLDEEEENNNAK